jgi:hypothetical protein
MTTRTAARDAIVGIRIVVISDLKRTTQLSGGRVGTASDVVVANAPESFA